MSVKTGVVALATGLVSFFAVGLGVTAATSHWVAYPLVLGLFVGSVAGTVATVAASLLLEDDVPEGRGRVAGSAVGFGVGLVGGVLLAAGPIGLGTAGSLGVGLAAAVVLAGTYASRTAPETTSGE